MMKRLAAGFALAVAVLLAAPSVGSAAEAPSPVIEVGSVDSVSVVFPSGSFAALSEVDISAVSGDSAPTKFADSAYQAQSDSLGGLAVSVRPSDASTSPEQLIYRGVLANGEAVQGVVPIEVTDMQNGFTSFLAQPTFVGMSMGALLWISMAVAALIIGLCALGRSRVHGAASSVSRPVSN